MRMYLCFFESIYPNPTYPIYIFLRKTTYHCDDNKNNYMYMYM